MISGGEEKTQRPARLLASEGDSAGNFGTDCVKGEVSSLYHIYGFKLEDLSAVIMGLPRHVDIKDDLIQRRIKATEVHQMKHRKVPTRKLELYRVKLSPA